VLCGFAGLPYDEAMVRFHEGRTRSDPGLDAKKAWLPPTPGLRDWRTQMAPEAVQRFEATAGELLDELGYARSSSKPGPAALALAERTRGRFSDDARSRGRTLPRGWRR
jgi:hypothetical protein